MDRLVELVGGCGGRGAIYAACLGDGREVMVGEVDQPFPTGSAGKLFVLLAFADAVEAGTLDPDQRVAVTGPYRDARMGSGVLRHLAAGLEPTLADCATLMVIVSDNVATDLLLDALGGPHAVNTTLDRLGCRAVEVTSSTVWVMPPGQFAMASPRGLARAWALLADDGPVAQRCRAVAWRQQQREGFGRLVPFSPDMGDFGLTSQLGLWSKAGSYPTVSCEGGLFETGAAAWVLAVMAEDLADWGSGSANAGPTLRAEAAKAVYDAWHQV